MCVCLRHVRPVGLAMTLFSLFVLPTWAMKFTAIGFFVMGVGLPLSLAYGLGRLQLDPVAENVHEE